MAGVGEGRSESAELRRVDAGGGGVLDVERANLGALQSGLVQSGAGDGPDANQRYARVGRVGRVGRRRQDRTVRAVATASQRCVTIFAP